MNLEHFPRQFPVHFSFDLPYHLAARLKDRASVSGVQPPALIQAYIESGLGVAFTDSEIDRLGLKL